MLPERPRPAAAVPRGLPEPDAAARRASGELARWIRREMAQGVGALPFERFMELALYAPGLGYYASGRCQFGEGGDFVTAPALGRLFGGCVARQCAQILTSLGGGRIVEAGAGDGALAADILLELAALDCLPQRYEIIELSPALRQRQRDTLARRAPAQLERVRWLDTLPAAPLRGAVIANELLDAMPVARFEVAGHDVYGAWVSDDGGRFLWSRGDVAPQLRQRIEALRLPGGFVSEINARAEAWVSTLAAALEAGVLLVIDYGFPAREFYHPQRSRGTLMCHYRHRAHDDPLINVGLQDITAHIDFTAIAAAGARGGLEVLGYTQLAPFLLSLGVLERVESARAGAVAHSLRLAQELKTLTLPSEMGELFKVLALGRGVSSPLAGFSLQDHRGRL